MGKIKWDKMGKNFLFKLSGEVLTCYVNSEDDEVTFRIKFSWADTFYEGNDRWEVLSEGSPRPIMYFKGNKT